MAAISFLAMFLDPVKSWLDDDEVSEILINGPDKIYVEQNGKLKFTDARFASESALRAAAVNIAKSVGRLLDDANPRLDARLPDGSRVHAVIPPLSRCGTVLAIRKFKSDSLSIEKLLKWESVSSDMACFLEKIVKAHKNILICGATSSGKTSILNVLSSFIAPDERILVIEDSSELQLQQPHLVSFETRNPDKDGKGEITVRDLIHSALRLRPDRLVLGEIRGGEALDLLQAMNTGHAGSMTTIHANNAQDSLLRLETCAMFSGVELPLHAIRSQIVAALDYIVHTGRLSDGSRKILSIAEVLPLQSGEYAIKLIWEWKMDSEDANGKLHGTFVLA